MTPTKEEVYAESLRLWKNDLYKHGYDQLGQNNPTEQELKESGVWSAAISQLMRDNPKAESAEWKSYNENLENSDDLKFDIKEGMATTTFISGSRGIGKTDLCMKIADQLMKEDILVVVFDPSMDWLKKSSIEQYFTVKPCSELLVPETSTIFDISRLTPNQAQRSVEQFCKKLFEFQLDNSAKRFYLVFEEAQIFFSLNSLRSLKTQNAMRILTTGRNFNVSLCAISQFAATIDKELVKHAGQIFLGYASELNTLAYWKGILGKKAEDLKKLQNGQFVYFNRNKISLTEIKPYESDVCKTQIQIPEVHPTEPITRPRASDIGTNIARLMIVAIFAVLLLRAMML
jgi:hypothetical protein